MNELRCFQAIFLIDLKCDAWDRIKLNKLVLKLESPSLWRIQFCPNKKFPFGKARSLILGRKSIVFFFFLNVGLLFTYGALVGVHLVCYCRKRESFQRSGVWRGWVTGGNHLPLSLLNYSCLLSRGSFGKSFIRKAFVEVGENLERRISTFCFRGVNKKPLCLN